MKLFSVRSLIDEEPLGELPSEREAFKKAFKIAWPSVLESVLIQLVSIVDTVMVGTLGSYAIAAVALTVQPKFIGLCIFISLSVAVSALVARRKGEEKRNEANRTLGQALVIAILLTVVISAACIVFAEPIIRLAGSDTDTHAYAVSYFRIIMGFMVFNVISIVINAAQRGAGNTKISMRTNLVSNLVNLGLNYLLIGGHFGFPALGVNGAAIATVIGTVVACGMSIFSLRKTDGFLSLKKVIRVKFDKHTLKSLTDLGSGTLTEQLFLRIGFFTFAAIVARLGTNMLATHQIGMNIMSVSFAFGDGLSVAAVTLVGQNLGTGRRDLAKMYGWLCQRSGIAIALVLSIVYIFFGRHIFGIFSDDPEIIHYGGIIMYLLVVIVYLQISQVVFSGCLRGAGDVKFTALVSLVSVAFVRPFMGWLFCYPLGMGLVGAWIGLSIDQLVRSVMTYVRFKRGKWTSIII